MGPEIRSGRGDTSLARELEAGELSPQAWIYSGAQNTSGQPLEWNTAPHGHTQLMEPGKDPVGRRESGGPAHCRSLVPGYREVERDFTRFQTGAGRLIDQAGEEKRTFDLVGIRHFSG